jgi:lipopolysaccharide export system permease protein
MRHGILHRHVLREVAVNVLATAVVLLVVLATYQLSFVLGRAARGEVPGAMVPELALLSARTSLTVILPFALLLGIVMALGRLYHENEIAAAQACGMPARVLFSAAAVVGIPATLLAAWAAFIDGPHAARRIVELRTQAQRSATLRQLVPGSFRSLGGGITLYFRDADADGSLREVFVQREPQAAGQRMQVLLAGSATQRLAVDGSAWLVELADGTGYEGNPGEADWRITSFSRELLRIPIPQPRLHGPPRVDGIGNRELLASTDPRQRAELHWRIGWVVAVAVLGMLAVPLARLRPRQGRHARVPWAVLLFAVYAGLLTAGRTMLGRGELPLSAGLWWVHAVALLSGWVLLRASRLRS